MEPSLTQRVLTYQRTGEGLEGILAEIAPRIYRYPLAKFGFGEDDCGEYYLFMYPRLLRTLKRFRDQGRPFEWYLNSVLCWQLREYRRRRMVREEDWYTASQPGLWEHRGEPAWCPPSCPEPSWGDAEPPDLDFLQELCGPRVSRAAGRRLLYWALKHPRQLTAADIRALAELTGLSEASLERAVRSVEGCLLVKEERLQRLVQRRNRAYARCLRLQAQAAREADPEHRRGIRLRFDKARDCLRKTQGRLAASRVRPSNREIAWALQVPKGTVDSSLYWLRRRVETLHQQRSSA